MKRSSHVDKLLADWSRVALARMAHEHDQE